MLTLIYTLVMYRLETKYSYSIIILTVHKHNMMTEVSMMTNVSTMLGQTRFLERKVKFNQ